MKKKYSLLPLACLFYPLYLVVLAHNLDDGLALPANQVSTMAGSGITGFANGKGKKAQFSLPTGIAIDVKGNLYVADFDNHRIRKVSSDGVVSTIAGNGNAGLVDGKGGQAQFNHPVAIAIDKKGNVYVADQGNHCIRKISPVGVVETLAGNGIPGFAEGAGAQAQFYSPTGLTVDKKGNVIVADRDNHRIRQISPLGVVSTLAGLGIPGFAEGPCMSSLFNAPNGVAVDSSGNLFVVEFIGQRIRKISLDGMVTTFAGNGKGGYADGLAEEAEFSRPTGVTIDTKGNVYVADAGNCCIRIITPTGVVSTVAGTGAANFKDNEGLLAQFNFPSELAVSPTGTLYVADANNHRIRRIEQVKQMSKLKYPLD